MQNEQRTFYRWKVVLVTIDGTYFTNTNTGYCQNKGICIRDAKVQADKMICRLEVEGYTINDVIIKIRKFVETYEDVEEIRYE